MPLGRVLLVDDESSLLKLIATYLARVGYEVSTATRTDDAWELFKEDPAAFQVILLDMSMEGLGAEELALRALRAAGDVRIIASSGYPPDLTQLEKAGPGRIGFLHKPYTPEMLADCIQRMLPR
jgi:DNA-binding NtrC family response regulator